MESRASGWPVLTSQTGPSAMAWTTHRQCRNQLYLQGATPAAPLQGLRTWQHPESSGWLRELCRELRGAVWVPWASPSPRLLGLCRIWADSPRSHGGSVCGGGGSRLRSPLGIPDTEPAARWVGRPMPTPEPLGELPPTSGSWQQGSKPAAAGEGSGGGRGMAPGDEAN